MYPLEELAEMEQQDREEEMETRGELQDHEDEWTKN